MKKKIMRLGALIVTVSLMISISLGFTGCDSSDNTTYEAPLKFNVVTSVNGIPKNQSQNAPAFVDGGAKGWTLQIVSEAGIDFLKFNIKADCEAYPIHGGDDPSTWLCYVEKGAGELILADQDKNEISRISYQQGDYIVLGPNNWHGWENGSTDSTLIVMRTQAEK